MDIKVRDLRQTDIIENENKLMVLVDDDLNLVKNITKEEFLTNVISSTENNALVQESDGNLYVNTSEIADDLATLSDKVDTIETNIGNLSDLTTEDKTNLVAAINEAAQSGGGGGSGYEVGDIVFRNIPTTDAGKHLLDGTLIQGSGIYSAFVQYIADLYNENPTANYFTDETTWQSSVSTYGVCGKFVYDSVNNTVRLPKYSNKIYTQDIDTTAPIVGNGMTLGLATGSNNSGLTGLILQSTGTFQNSPSVYGMPVNSSYSTSGYATSRSVGVTTDPTKSGLIAQLSDITTSLDGYYYIVVATSTKTDIQVDIDEITTDLNGKADVDLTNAVPTSLFATAMNTAGIRTVVETYVNGTSWYRVYSDGWCEQGGAHTNSAGQNPTISLIKTFINTNYTLEVLGYTNATGGAYYSAGIYSKTVSNFRLYATHNDYVDWRACGYIN